jgi:hypothetical protein
MTLSLDETKAIETWWLLDFEEEALKTSWYEVIRGAGTFAVRASTEEDAVEKTESYNPPIDLGKYGSVAVSFAGMHEWYERTWFTTKPDVALMAYTTGEKMPSKELRKPYNWVGPVQEQLF